jgi:hypothetical protein
MVAVFGWAWAVGANVYEGDDVIGQEAKQTVTKQAARSQQSGQ